MRQLQQNNPLIQIEDLSVRIKHRLVLNEINFELNRGEIVTLIGPNGAGKSTLVKCIVGLLHPSSGRIRRQPNIILGYTPQKIHIEPILPMTVERFLKMAPMRVALEPTCKQVGVDYLLKEPLQGISGGEWQRVLLARALLGKPDLLVLDEPAQGVDLIGQSELYRLISQIKSEFQCGVLMVSHDLNLVMAETDHVICLNYHVCCSGHPEKISRDPVFLELFGLDSKQFAFYAHHHDHQHDRHGKIVDDDALKDA